MKLYDTPLAPNPRRVRWVMAEKGIDDIEIVTVNLFEGQHRQPEYLGKAGLPNVPMLEMDDGTCVTESVAICRYLESRYPEPNLFGRTPEETAVIEMWLRRGEMMVAGPFMTAVRFSHPALAALEPPNPAVAEHARNSALRALKMLDRRLADREWLAVERISIADIVTYTGIDFGRMIKFFPPEELAGLGRWVAAMKDRPAARAGMPAPAAA
jgi:glutathione S-transferase